MHEAIREISIHDIIAHEPCPGVQVLVSRHHNGQTAFEATVSAVLKFNVYERPFGLTSEKTENGILIEKECLTA
jgi:hypothetical protein